MTSGIVFGVLGGLALAKFIARRRRFARGYGGYGGCGGHAWRRGHGYDDLEAPLVRERGFHIPRRGAVWLGRELALDEAQQGEVDRIVRKARGAAGRFGFAGRGLLAGLAGALGEEVFDRARIDGILAQSGPLANVRQEIADGLERLHLTLSSEQRERLRDLAGGRAEAEPPTVA